MNTALMNQLEDYFYGEKYQNAHVEIEDVKEAFKAYCEHIESLKQKDKASFLVIDDLITDIEVAHEKQGFMRGYEYCLIMIGQ